MTERLRFPKAKLKGKVVDLPNPFGWTLEEAEYRFIKKFAPMSCALGIKLMCLSNEMSESSYEDRLYLDEQEYEE